MSDNKHTPDEKMNQVLEKLASEDEDLAKVEDRIVIQLEGQSILQEHEMAAFA